MCSKSLNSLSLGKTQLLLLLFFIIYSWITVIFRPTLIAFVSVSFCMCVCVSVLFVSHRETKKLNSCNIPLWEYTSIVRYVWTINVAYTRLYILLISIHIKMYVSITHTKSSVTNSCTMNKRNNNNKNIEESFNWGEDWEKSACNKKNWCTMNIETNTQIMICSIIFAAKLLDGVNRATR